MGRLGVLGCSICAVVAAGCFAAGGSRRGRGIIDVHAHIQVTDYLAVLASAGVHRPSFGPPPSGPEPPSPAGDSDAALELRLQMMDAAGVARQVLSPTLAPYTLDANAAVSAARLVNDRHAALTRRFPGRLASFVSLPLPHRDASLAELRRGMDDLGMAGVTLQCSCLGVSIADPRYEPLFAEMHRRRSVLFLHPAVNGLLSPLVNDFGLAAAAGPLLEDAVVAMQLMVRGIPQRYPGIRIVVPHLGGGLATMLERLDNQLPQFTPGFIGRPSEIVRGLWYDTVSHGSRPSLRAAVDAFGPDRLVPGSDFPVLNAFEPYGDTIGYVAKAGLRRRDADAILYANAPRLLQT